MTQHCKNEEDDDNNGDFITATTTTTSGEGEDTPQGAATVTIADLVATVSSHADADADADAEGNTNTATTATNHHSSNSCAHSSATGGRVMQNDSNKDNGSGSITSGLEKLLLAKLTDDQGITLKQLLLSCEKEYQHQVQLLMKEKNYELMMERNDFALIVEKKNSEIAKQQTGLGLVENKRFLTLSFVALVVLYFVLFLFQRVLMSPASSASCSVNEKLIDRTKPFDTARMEGIIVLSNMLLDRVEQLEVMMDKVMETNETKMEQDMKQLKRMVLSKPLAFENKKKALSWETFVASSWPAMRFGKHKWTIKFGLGYGYDFMVNVGLITVDDHLKDHQKYDSNEVLGCNIPGWAFNHNRELWHGCEMKKDSLPRVNRGDSITFVLDLRPKEDDNDDSHNDSLYVRVNSASAQYLLVSGLSKIAKSKGGFFPAVSITGQHQVEFYDYEYIMEE